MSLDAALVHAVTVRRDAAGDFRLVPSTGKHAERGECGVLILCEDSDEQHRIFQAAKRAMTVREIPDRPRPCQRPSTSRR